MADFQVTGHISRIRRKNGVICVYVDEYMRGFRRSDGEVVQEKHLTWCCVFKNAFSNFLDRVGIGGLVTIKGEILPYGRSIDEKVEGYTLLGQVINIASYPKFLRTEEKLVRDSSKVLDDVRLSSSGGDNNADVVSERDVSVPDIYGFSEPDF